MIPSVKENSGQEFIIEHLSVQFCPSRSGGWGCPFPAQFGDRLGGNIQVRQRAV